MSSALSRTISVSDVGLKVVVLGDAAVGKTCLVHRYVVGNLPANVRSTMVVDLHTKKVRVEGCNVELSIWDTAGQERFRAVTNVYYRQASGALLIFDVTDEKSFQNIKNYWLPEAFALGSRGLVFILVGNKCDCGDKRTVSEEAIRELCHDQDIQYIETSAVTGQEVDTAFETVVRLILHQKFEAAHARTQQEQQSKAPPAIDNNAPLLKLQADMNEEPPKRMRCCQA